jgi:hypothetical protein
LSMSGVGTHETDPSESYHFSCAITRNEKIGGNEGWHSEFYWSHDTTQHTRRRKFSITSHLYSIAPQRDGFLFCTLSFARVAWVNGPFS